MNDAGWASERNADGAVDGPRNLTRAQLEKWQQASEDCRASSGWATPFSDYSSAQSHELYTQEVDEQTCLSEHGYPGPMPPSEQTFLDTLSTETQYYAFDVLDGIGAKEYRAIIRVCPPPTLFLNIAGLD